MAKGLTGVDFDDVQQRLDFEVFMGLKSLDSAWWSAWNSKVGVGKAEES